MRVAVGGAFRRPAARRSCKSARDLSAQSGGGSRGTAAPTRPPLAQMPRFWGVLLGAWTLCVLVRTLWRAGPSSFPPHCFCEDENVSGRGRD